MDARNIIKANEIPVDQLALVGVDEKMLFGLHPKELERMMRGRMSPLIADLKVKDGQRELAAFSGKLRFVREQDGKVNLMVYPARKQMRNDYGLSKEQLEKLKDGKPLLVDVATQKGKEKMILQCDKETNVVMAVKQKDLRIPQAIGDIVLGEEQKQRFVEGKPIELSKENTKITVGVDLDDPTGCRVVRGDLDRWQQVKLEQWDRRTPDAYGYWKTTENGLQYKSFVEKQQGIGQEQEQQQQASFGRRR